MPKGKDWVGLRFGRLVVVAVGPMQGGNRKYACRCDCGRELEVFRSALSMGWTQSCGCLAAERRHQPKPRPAPKGTKDPLWSVWKNMVARCENVKAAGYSGCGAKGLTVCERWRDDFWAFKEDMGDQPPGMVLGRKDVTVGFAPENCAWMTRIELAAIVRPRPLIDIGGEKRTLAEWAREVGLPTELVGGRRRLGWSWTKALTTPVGRRRNG